VDDFLVNYISKKLTTVKPLICNIVGFNTAWFGLVYWGNSFIPISFILLLIHLHFFSKYKKEWLLILVITFIGIIVDSLLMYFAVFIFADNSHLPFWLMMLWACFSATLCHSLRFLSDSTVLQLLVGGLFAPLSYIAGYKFQAVEFGYSLIPTYFILTIIWGVLFVIFFYLKDKIINNEGCYA